MAAVRVYFIPQGTLYAYDKPDRTQGSNWASRWDWSVRGAQYKGQWAQWIITMHCRWDPKAEVYDTDRDSGAMWRGLEIIVLTSSMDRIISGIHVCVLNRSLDGLNARMGRARSLDSLSSEWAWPMYSPKNLVNGNEAHSLDEWSRFGSAALIDSASYVRRGTAARKSTNDTSNKWMIAMTFIYLSFLTPSTFSSWPTLFAETLQRFINVRNSEAFNLKVQPFYQFIPSLLYMFWAAVLYISSEEYNGAHSKVRTN